LYNFPKINSDFWSVCRLTVVIDEKYSIYYFIVV
jgi:hypothetical protein